jgi:rRNA maturation endonuclease Nob1
MTGASSKQVSEDIMTCPHWRLCDKCNRLRHFDNGVCDDCGSEIKRF